MLKIEKGIPRLQPNQEYLEVARQMEIDDSVECSKLEARRLSYALEKMDRKGSIKNVGDAYRIWRIQ